MSDYPDESHPTQHWTVRALWPPHGGDAGPAWRACFFDTSRDGAVRSMAWALDQEEGLYARALDFRVAPPTLARPTAGAPWDPPAARRRAAKEAASSAQRAAEREARSEPSPALDRPSGAVLAPPRAPRARASARFRDAARSKRARRG